MLDEKIESRLSNMAERYKIATLGIKDELHPIVLVTRIAVHSHSFNSRVGQDKGAQAHV